MKILKEGNLSTGQWKRYYQLDNGLLVAMITSVLPDPRTVSLPERQWAGVIFSDETEKTFLHLPDVVGPGHVLLSLVSKTSSIPNWEHVFFTKELDIDRVIQLLNEITVSA